MIAACWRDGSIVLKQHAPRGTVKIAEANGRKLRPVIEAVARHAYDGKTLLVPGVPEADTAVEAITAVNLFREQVLKRLAVPS